MKKLFGLAALLSSLYCTPALTATTETDALQLASVSAAVAKLGDEKPEFSKRADWVMPIASITKLMTALVVVESGEPLDTWLPILERHADHPAAANAYSRIRVQSEATRRDLLQLALMSSENRAAYLLARHHFAGYDAFVAAMNAKAKQLGMFDTHFVDPTGLSDANVSTAGDLLRLANAAFQQPLIRELSTSPGRWVEFRRPRYGLQYGNTNPLIHSKTWDVFLSKTGYLTNSGRCLVMVADVAGEPRVMVLLDSLGTRSPSGDAGRIKRWLETGAVSKISGAALDYEREKSAARAARMNQSASL